MGRTNYSKMSTQKLKPQNDIVREPIDKADLEPEVDESCDACAITFDKKSEAEENIQTKIGQVQNCARLNVREKPNTNAKVLEIIEGWDKVNVIPSESVKDWYMVVTSKGTKGYCMKEYITIV